MAATESLQKYYDTLIANYDILVEALEKASAHNLNVARQFASDVVAGQRQALELGKKLAAQPADLPAISAALFEATTAAQGRALSFAQAALQEALASGADTRELIQRLLEANREFAANSAELARQWMTLNPFAEMLKKGFEAFKPAAASTSN
ncbi:hypothetical protein [Tepidiforma sp.]|uniref:hypothetical protein n=1 Tax=Tepidiforma sp. TaxID=2682230 RepID=UPI002ADD7BED|nr:hypothetical protein [Tepidiforma sp.]